MNKSHILISSHVYICLQHATFSQTNTRRKQRLPGLNPTLIKTKTFLFIFFFLFFSFPISFLKIYLKSSVRTS